MSWPSLGRRHRKSHALRQKSAGSGPRNDGQADGEVHKHLRQISGTRSAKLSPSRRDFYFEIPFKGGTVTPDEQLKRLAAELDRLKSEHPNAHGTLRLTNTCLRPCSKWKWERHGWSITDGEACGIMNGDDEAQRTALLSVLKGYMIRKVEFTADADYLEVVADS